MPSHAPQDKKKKKKKKLQLQQVTTRNGQRITASRVRIDRIVEDFLSGDVSVSDGSSLFALDDSEQAGETRGQMLQRHKAERKALGAHLAEIMDQRRRLKKGLENDDARKELRNQTSLLSTQLRLAHEQQLRVFVEADNADDVDIAKLVDAGQLQEDDAEQAPAKRSKKDGPLRVLSTVHTPGPQSAKNTKPPAK